MPIESELVAREDFPASDIGAEALERGVRKSEKIHASVREVEVLQAERAQERVVQLCARERSAHGLTTAGVRSTNASAINLRKVALGVSSKCRASHARRR